MNRISDAVLRGLVLEACRKALAAGETPGDASLRKHGARGDCTRLLAMRDELIRSGEIVLPDGMRLTRPTASPGRAQMPKPVDPDASPLADTIREAKAFVRRHHRHNMPPLSWKFGVGLERDGELIGVAMAGRPVARPLDIQVNLFGEEQRPPEPKVRWKRVP